MQYHLHQNKTLSTLSFFPNVRGIGFSYFGADKQYQNSGMITTRNRYTTDKYIQRMKEKIDTYQPQILVLEEYKKSKGSIKTKRIASLIKTIAKYAEKQKITVVFYKRSDIRDVFSFFKVLTKHDIAKLICLWIPILERFMYKPRTAGKMEPYSSAIFEAVSLCICYFYKES